MRILYVCTANICRSASAQRLLLDAVAAAPELSGIEVVSAGTHARPGLPGCSMAPALAGHAVEHRSQVLTAELVAWADLILPAARDHRTSIVQLAPDSRARTFTIRQAGRIAEWIVDWGIVAAGRERSVWGEGPEAWVERFLPGDPRRDLQALPDHPAGRGLWIVSEMDAARGMAVAPPVGAASGDGAGPSESRRPRWLTRGRGSENARAIPRPVSSGASPTDRAAIDPGAWHPDDVPDPHHLGAGLHAMAFEQIQSSTDALVRLLREVASEAGGRAGGRRGAGAPPPQ